MDDKAKNKARLEGGLKALGTQRDAHDSKPVEYSDTPMTGSIRVPCKNKECNAIVESGFVWNMEDWITIFTSKPHTCPVCQKTAEYSHDDVEYFPSKS